MPVQQARARNRRERILDAAAEVFSRRGYAGAGMDEIARGAETSKGGLYFHFPGKEALLLALLDRTAALLLARVQEAIAAEAEPVARAEAVLRMLLQTLGRHRRLARLFALEALAAGPRFTRRVGEIQDQFAAMIQEQLDDAIAQGHIESIDTGITAQAWVGILNGVLTRSLLGPSSPDLDEVYPTLRLLLLRSVGAAGGQRATAAAIAEG